MVSWTGIFKFGVDVVHLPSFPLFCAYLLMIALAGTWQKVSRPISNIRKVMIGYNLLCSSISLYTFIGMAVGMHQEEEGIFAKNKNATLAWFIYVYYLTKILELLDTVFMVLRHSRRQITLLHVYHHASMLILSDYSQRYTPWAAIAFILCINSLVHVFTYFYYGLTAYDPNATPSWKRRITEMQIIQFTIDFFFALNGYFNHGFCVYGFIYGILMTSLFLNFYYHSYINPKKRKSRKAVNGDISNGSPREIIKEKES